MKLKFTIPYRAHWGETLSVAITWKSRDGHTVCRDVDMNTLDGYLWEAETQSPQSRQRPLVSMAYCYKVKDGAGNVIRCESTEHPRILPFDGQHSFFFSDFWLDGDYDRNWLKKQHPRLPLYDSTVLFKVVEPHLYQGEAIALLGNHPALGDWNVDRYLKMMPTGDGSWVLSVDVQAVDKPLAYKYVVIDERTQKLKRWEEGPNRTMNGGRILPGEVHMLHGGNFRVKELPLTAQFCFDTYIFDLDGTLLSTLADLAASCNYALRTNGLPEHSVDDVRRFVGNGVKMLMVRAIPGGENNPKFEKTFADFRKHYMVHNLDTTAPYPGVMEMLAELKARGKAVAVVSNKFYAATQALCQHFFGPLVDVAIGEREGIRKKPAPDTVNEALRQLGADSKGAVYIGDSDVDVMTARASGMPCISVLWGFRSRDFLIEHGATILVHSPKQIVE